MQLEHQKISLAIVYSMLTALMYALMGVFVRMAPDAPVMMVLFVRFFVGFVLLSPFIFRKQPKELFDFKWKRWSLHLLRCAAGLLSIGLYFLSIRYIPLVDALLLESTYPLFMPLLIWIFFGVRSRFSLVLATIVGFVGVIFMLRPAHLSFQWGDLIALASGFWAAIIILTVRQLSKTERRADIISNYFMLAVVICGISAVFEWKPLRTETWILLILVGVAATIYQYALTAALSHASARIVSPLLYFTLVFTGLIEWYFWHYFPNIGTIIGMLLIVGSGVVTILVRDDAGSD